MRIPFEPLPQGMDLPIADYLTRMIANINTSFDVQHHFDVRNTLPNKYRIGDVFYFGQPILPDITEEGLWVYKSVGWTQIA